MLRKAPALFILSMVSMVALALAGPGESAGVDAPAEARPEKPQPRTIPVSVGKATVAVDPETGRLVPPTPEQARELAASMRAMFGDNARGQHTPVRHPDGTLSLVVDPSFHNFTVARTTSDGGLQVSCVAGPEAAADAVTEAETPDRKGLE